MLTIWCLGWARMVRGNHFEITLVYVITAKNVSHQQLYGLILKEDSIVLEEEQLKLSKYLLN